MINNLGNVIKYSFCADFDTESHPMIILTVHYDNGTEEYHAHMKAEQTIDDLQIPDINLEWMKNNRRCDQLTWSKNYVYLDILGFRFHLYNIEYKSDNAATTKLKTNENKCYPYFDNEYKRFYRIENGERIYYYPDVPYEHIWLQNTNSREYARSK